MYVAFVPNKEQYRGIYLQESHREGKKIIKKTVATITGWDPKKIALLQQILKGETIPFGTHAFSITESLPHGAAFAVLETMKKLNLPLLLFSKDTEPRRIILALIAQRILSASSKIAALDALLPQTATSTLYKQLGLKRLNRHKIYGSLDILLSWKDRIEKELSLRHLKDSCLVLYDVTCVFFESKTCTMVKIGRGKNGEYVPQILVGVLTNIDGIPIGDEVFEGNLKDHQTLFYHIQKLRKKHGVKKLIITGDRGTIIEKKIEQIKKIKDVAFITALTAVQIQKLAARDISQTMFDEKDLAEITSDFYPNERLIVCRNQALAKERTRIREELLQATEIELDKIVTAAQRKKRQLKDKGKIGIRVGKVINTYKMAKHFTLTIEEGSFIYCRKQESIEKEKLLDGIYCIRTTVTEKTASGEKAVELYKNLKFVERSFRVMKTTDLRMGPVYLQLDKRVKSHIFLCTLSLYVEYFMRKALSPIIFQDDEEDKEQAQKERQSIVAKAIRSDIAKKKDGTRVTSDGFPVLSFRELLLTLATQTENTIVPIENPELSFPQLSVPTPFQKKAFQLLGAVPALLQPSAI